MSSLSATLSNILRSPLSSIENAETNELNDTDTEEYYVCVKCEYLGNEHHNHDDHHSNGSACYVHEEDEATLCEPKSEPVEPNYEPSASSEATTIHEPYVENESEIDDAVNSIPPAVTSIGVQTETSIDAGLSATHVASMPEVSPTAVDHESESNGNNSNETATSDQIEHSFTESAYEPSNEFDAPSQLSDRSTSSAASPVNAYSNSGRTLSTPTPRTPQIQSKQLLSIFQNSPGNIIGDLSKLLKNAGVEIVGEDDLEFVNEIKEAKIKVETPGSIKKEAISRKRKRSPKFYTPAKRKAVRKGSIGVVNTKKTGETKAFKEWDSDEYISDSDY